MLDIWTANRVSATYYIFSVHISDLIGPDALPSLFFLPSSCYRTINRAWDRAWRRKKTSILASFNLCFQCLQLFLKRCLLEETPWGLSPPSSSSSWRLVKDVLVPPLRRLLWLSEVHRQMVKGKKKNTAATRVFYVSFDLHLAARKDSGEGVQETESQCLEGSWTNDTWCLSSKAWTFSQI